MADSDFVTEGQLNSLVTALITGVNAATAITVSDTAPSSPATNDLWIDSDAKFPGWGLINHGATASTARGTEFENYIWVGSVQPTNISGQDIVIRTDEAV